MAWEPPFSESVNFPFQIPKLNWSQKETTEQGGNTVTNMISLSGRKIPVYEALGLYDNQINTRIIMPLPSNSIYSTELNRIEDEAFIDIISGQRPVSYFDTFVANWKAAGGDVLTREAQTVPRTPGK
jgi:hypothetical protein